jgi:DNA modification methylase
LDFNDLLPKIETAYKSDKKMTNYNTVWDNIKKTADELKINHPSVFPLALVEKVIKCFCSSSDKIILDPFMGSGSTLVTAKEMGKTGIGIDLYDEYIKIAKERLGYNCKKKSGSFNKSFRIYKKDARHILECIKQDTVDFCFTSPPYWNILTEKKRLSLSKKIMNFDVIFEDIGKIANYNDFLNELNIVFQNIYKLLHPGKLCAVNLMDIYKDDIFYPYCNDFISNMRKLGFIFECIIIWDRRKELSYLDHIKYFSRSRLNLVHEYILIFKKPKIKKGDIL